MQEQIESEKIAIFSGRHTEVFDTSLLLSSQNIPHWIEARPNATYELFVETSAKQKTHELIETYQKENFDFFGLARSEHPLVYKPQTLLLLLIPTLFFILETAFNLKDRLHNLGNADSQRIINGEWWRAVTALTLHADIGHYASNMISGFLIFNLIAVRTTIGFWLFGTLVSSGIANYSVALTLSATEHHSIGFSTVVFGGLGLLAMIEVRSSISQLKAPALHTIAPIIAALFLVVFMGISEQSDILAHFFGFFFGLLYGVIVPLTTKQERWGNLFLITLAYILIAMSWIFAAHFHFFA